VLFENTTNSLIRQFQTFRVTQSKAVACITFFKYYYYYLFFFFFL